MCRGIQWHPHGIFWRLCIYCTNNNVHSVVYVPAICSWCCKSLSFGCIRVINFVLITNIFYRGMMGWVWVNQRDQTSVWTPTEIKHFTYVLHCIPILREVYWELFPLFSLEMFPNASSLDFFLWDSIWVLWLQYIYVACNVIISRCCAFRSWAGFLAFCIFIFKHFF